jgi:hypothetical protein
MKPPPADRPGVDMDVAAGRRWSLIQSLVGQKVSLSTTDFHHVVGRLIALAEGDSLRLMVNNQEVVIRRQGVARIHAADPALAEYIK